MAANTMNFEWDRECIALHQETIFYRLHAWMKKEHKMHFQNKISSKLSSLWVHFKISNPALTNRHQLFSVLPNITDYTNTKSSELSHQWLRRDIAVPPPQITAKCIFFAWCKFHHMGWSSWFCVAVSEHIHLCVGCEWISESCRTELLCTDPRQGINATEILLQLHEANFRKRAGKVFFPP